ncbi:MAG: hypothetical protein PHS86_03225 [Syntrophaceae bacterium]|nr:hypothetical protein [Syntrophaceae bacterium]
MVKDSARYIVHVFDERIEIEGVLTIREAFDMLNYFDQQGFNTIESNYDQNTLTMRKRDFEKEERTRIIEESISDNKFYQNLYNKEKDQFEKHRIRITQLENLLKTIMSESKIKETESTDLRNELAKFKALLKLEQAYKRGEINEPTETVDDRGNVENNGSNGIKDSCESETKPD